MPIDWRGLCPDVFIMKFDRRLLTERDRLINEIDRIVWCDDEDSKKINSLQSLMYQWGANMDHRTEQLFGSDQRSLEVIQLQQGFRR